MKIRALCGAMAAAMLVPAIGHAEFTYTGLEVGFVDVELDGIGANVDGDGLRFGGTYAVNDNFFFLGEFEDYSFDSGVDGSTLEVGGGYHQTLGPTLDFVATASYIETEVEYQNFTADDDGIGLGGGIRARVADSFEVDAMLNWVDMDRGGSDTGIQLRGRYYFNEHFAIGAETQLDDNFDTFSIGIRAEF
jgi:opacity protein-like surface antigen